MNTLLLNTGDIMAWMQSVLWPFIRIAGMFSIAPVFGSRTVPVRIRVGGALVISLLVAPSLSAAGFPDPLSAPGVLAIGTQLLIGLSMGFVLQLLFTGLYLSGEIIATPMGLSMARATDPINGVQIPVLGQIVFMLGMLLFLAMDGHLALMRLLLDSFQTLPVSTDALAVDSYWQIAQWGKNIFIIGLQVALPAATALLATNLALGVITRAAPQLNIFTFGLPITTVLGLIMLLLILPELIPAVRYYLAAAFALMNGIYLG